MKNLKSESQWRIHVTIFRWMEQFYRAMFKFTVELWCPTIFPKKKRKEKREWEREKKILNQIENCTLKLSYYACHKLTYHHQQPPKDLSEQILAQPSHFKDDSCYYQNRKMVNIHGTRRQHVSYLCQFLQVTMCLCNWSQSAYLSVKLLYS